MIKSLDKRTCWYLSSIILLFLLAVGYKSLTSTFLLRDSMLYLEEADKLYDIWSNKIDNPVFDYPSPLFVILIAVPKFLGIPPLWMGHFIVMSCGAGLIFNIFIITRKVFKANEPALFSAYLAATVPFYIEYSAEIMRDIPFYFLYSTCLIIMMDFKFDSTEFLVFLLPVIMVLCIHLRIEGWSLLLLWGIYCSYKILSDRKAIRRKIQNISISIVLFVISLFLTTEIIQGCSNGKYTPLHSKSIARFMHYNSI